MKNCPVAKSTTSILKSSTERAESGWSTSFQEPHLFTQMMNLKYATAFPWYHLKLTKKCLCVLTRKSKRSNLWWQLNFGEMLTNRPMATMAQRIPSSRIYQPWCQKCRKIQLIVCWRKDLKRLGIKDLSKRILLTTWNKNFLKLTRFSKKSLTIEIKNSEKLRLKKINKKTSNSKEISLNVQALDTSLISSNSWKIKATNKWGETNW